MKYQVQSTASHNACLCGSNTKQPRIRGAEEEILDRMAYLLSRGNNGMFKQQ